MGRFIDLTGNRYGKLTVVRRDGYIGKTIAWLCKCDCGNYHRIRGSSLRNLGVKQCPECAGKQRIDLIGQRFGRLTVVEYVGMRGNNSFWHCVCDCGNKVDVSSGKLRSGWTQSCGCLHKELLSLRNKSHGKSGTRGYVLYASMKDRCYNEKSAEYHRYGGRGISVCDEWLSDFDLFYRWLIDSGYEEDAPRGVFTIDRIDNDGGYSPDNCRLISIQQQNRRRKEVEVEYQDGTIRRFWSIRALAKRLHIDKKLIAEACKSGEPLKGLFRCRACSTLKLLGNPDDYIDGAVVL